MDGSQASGSEEFVESTDDEFDLVEAIIPPEIQSALRDLDEVDLEDEFAHRGCVMKNIPRFLKGFFSERIKICIEGDNSIPRRSGEVFQRLEIAHASPAVVVVSTPKRWEHQQTEVEPTVPGFREGTLGSICWTPADPARRFLRQLVFDRDVAVATGPRTSTNMQPKLR